MLSEGFRPFVEDLASTTDLRGNVREDRLPELALQVVRKRLATRSRTVLDNLRSPKKRRYIVAPRLYQQSSGPTIQSSLRIIQDTLKPSILRSEHATGPKVLDLLPLEAALLRERFPSLLVERDIQHQLARTPLCPDLEPISVPASHAKSLTVEVLGEQQSLPEAQVLLFTDFQNRVGYKGRTDAKGRLRLSIRSGDTSFEKVLVLPAAGFWSRVWKKVGVASKLRLEVPALKVQGFDWGLVATEAGSRGTRYGQDVKVAIIDSGIGPHSSLTVAGGKSFIVGEGESDWQDQDGHGTHCAGVIAALEASASIWGYAPKVEIYSLRIFGGEDGGGYSSDIANAIDWAVERGCDIISMSLTMNVVDDKPSGFVRQKIEKATDRGVLCIAATGNESGPVRYPARFPNVIGVSALGQPDTFPAESLHEEARTQIQSSDKQYFFASFSNHGEEVDLCAPGVAITSTLPADRFGAWDGTSMACPHIAGIAALALEASPAILQSPRDAERMGLLIDCLNGLCLDLGMPRKYQGAGLPRLGRLFQA